MQKIDIKLIPVNFEGVPIKNKVEYANRMSHLVFRQDSPSNKIPIQKKDDKPLPYRIKFRMKKDDKSNCFQIKIIRDDGEIIGWPENRADDERVRISIVSTLHPDASKFPYINIDTMVHTDWSYNSVTGIWSYSPYTTLSPYYGKVVATFNTKTKYWCLYFLPEQSIETGEKFYINVKCTFSVATQYPYKYRTSTQGNPDDAVLPGVYEVQVPYWKTITVKNPDFGQPTRVSPTYAPTPYFYRSIHPDETGYCALWTSTGFRYMYDLASAGSFVQDKDTDTMYWPATIKKVVVTVTVYSSIPWTYTEGVGPCIWSGCGLGNRICYSDTSEEQSDVYDPEIPCTYTITGNLITFSGSTYSLPSPSGKTSSEQAPNIYGTKLTLTVETEDHPWPSGSGTVNGLYYEFPSVSATVFHSVGSNGGNSVQDNSIDNKIILYASPITS